MNSVKKLFYIIIGMIAFVLGAIGVVLPVLPTAPFILLASFCFVRGSEKFDIWLKGTKVYKKHLETFVEDKAMTLKQKIYTSTFADIMIAYSALSFSVILVASFKLYYFTFKIKTIKSDSLIN